MRAAPPTLLGSRRQARREQRTRRWRWVSAGASRVVCRVVGCRPGRRATGEIRRPGVSGRTGPRAPAFTRAPSFSRAPSSRRRRAGRADFCRWPGGWCRSWRRPACKRGMSTDSATPRTAGLGSSSRPPIVQGISARTDGHWGCGLLNGVLHRSAPTATQHQQLAIRGCPPLLPASLFVRQCGGWPGTRRGGWCWRGSWDCSRRPGW
jgi:hypothetical protein